MSEFLNKRKGEKKGSMIFGGWHQQPHRNRHYGHILRSSTPKATMTSPRRRLLVVPGLFLASGVASSASDHQSALHRQPGLPRGRRHFSSVGSQSNRNCANADHSRLLLSKALFFSGQPVLSFILATKDEQRRMAAIRCAAAHQSSVPRYGTASASYESGLQIRGGVSSAGSGPAAMPLLALAQDIVSVGTAALVGAAFTLGERFFTLLGWEVPAFFGRRTNAAKDGSDIFGSSAGTAIAAAPAVPKAAVGFAASSTLIGACLILAAVAVLAINPANAVSFFVFDGLAIVITLLGILVADSRMESINMLATRGVLPMSILLGLLGFLGIYA